MSALHRLRALAQGALPDDDGLLGNVRLAWGGTELLGEESVLASFAARPFDSAQDLLAVESRCSAALIGEDSALVADLCNGRIGRLWRVGGEAPEPPPQAVDVAFDPDMHQRRGQLYFRAADHPQLAGPAAEQLLATARSLADRIRAEGNLRVRAYVVRAFGDNEASAALLALHVLGNETARSAGFRNAVVGAGGSAGRQRAVIEPKQARPWTPRL